jgi:hypothetical protein
MGMKGSVASSFLLVAMVVALFMVIFDPTGAMYAGEIEDITLRKDALLMRDALGGAKLYSQTALEYSIYQAVYDYLKSEHEGIPKDSEIDSALSGMIKENMDVYTNQDYIFMSDYRVSFPEYSVEARREYGKLIVSLTSDQHMHTEKTQEEGETIRLGESFGIEASYDIDFEKIIAEGEWLNTLASQGLDAVIRDEVNRLPGERSWPIEECGTAQGHEEQCLSRLSEYISVVDIQDSLKTSIESSIDDRKADWIPSNLFDTAIETLSIRAQVLIGGGYDSCGGEPILNCDFLYQVESTLRASVSPKNAGTHPVFTGEKVETVPMGMVFLVKQELTLPESLAP